MNFPNLQGRLQFFSILQTHLNGSLGNETIFTPKSVNKPGAKLVTLNIPDIATADFLLVAN